MSDDVAARLELTAYVYPGWEPRLRAARAGRDWMDASAEAFPYRCLPLTIANTHGWEVPCPHGFSAVWTGGPLPEDVRITPDDAAAPAAELPAALFGQGIVTFHIAAILRTSPGWNLWVSGPPNSAKDGVAPLSGLIETDWSPYTFTMNWRLTRPGLPVHFARDEPICFFFPVMRHALERFDARVAPIDEAPQLKRDFEQWSTSRSAFQQRVAASPPRAPADKWQKLYYRGLSPSGRVAIDDHIVKLKACPFASRSGREDGQT